MEKLFHTRRAWVHRVILPLQTYRCKFITSLGHGGVKRQTCAVAIRHQRDYIDSKQERYHWMHIRSNRYYIEEKAAVILDAYMYGRQ